MKEILFEYKKKIIHHSLSEVLSPIPHIHREVEIIYVENGSATAFSNEKFDHIDTGDLFISFPNQVHYYKYSKTGKYHLLYFSPDIIFGFKHIFFEQYPTHSTIKVKDTEQILNLFRNLSNDYGKYTETAHIGIVNEIIAIIMNYFQLSPRINSEDATLSQITKFCEENYAEDVTLTNLSEKLNLNKFYISHLLNQKLGLGFSYYINTLRIKAACELLSDTDEKISYISEEVGFGSIRSFNRAFTEIMNTTPLKYRNITSKIQVRTSG